MKRIIGMKTLKAVLEPLPKMGELPKTGKVLQAWMKKLGVSRPDLIKLGWCRSLLQVRAKALIDIHYYHDAAATCRDLAVVDVALIEATARKPRKKA